MKIIIDIKKNLTDAVIIAMLHREDICGRIAHILDQNAAGQEFMNQKGEDVYSIKIERDKEGR